MRESTSRSRGGTKELNENLAPLKRFLHGTDRITQDPPPEDVDLVVTVDFGSVDRAKFALPTRPPIANIDHHASNDRFGVANFVKIQETDFEPRFFWCSLTVDGVQAPIDRFSIVHVVIAEQIKAMLTYACGSLDKRVHLIRHSVPNHVDAFTDL